MAPRIALSGSAGIGKTTLARRLAADLGVPYIPEGMRAYLERGGADLHALGRSGLRALVLQLWDEQREAEARATSGFVADRSAFDFAAFWIYYGYAADDPETETLFAQTQDPLRYDAVWLLPWGAFPIEADGIRSSNRWIQLHAHVLIEGMLHRANAPLRHVTAEGVDARVAQICGAIGRAGVGGALG
jgi:nicotinamide riboside kinase